MRRTDKNANELVQHGLDHEAYMSMQVVLYSKEDYLSYLGCIMPNFVPEIIPDVHGNVRTQVWMADRKMLINVSYHESGTENLVIEDNSVSAEQPKRIFSDGTITVNNLDITEHVKTVHLDDDNGGITVPIRQITGR